MNRAARPTDFFSRTLLQAAAGSSLLMASACSSAEPPKQMFVQELAPAPIINSYEDCVAAGNMTTKSQPPRCIAADGQSYTRGEPPTVAAGVAGGAVPNGKINSFEACVAAGYAIRRTLPPTCADEAGNVYTEGREGVTRIQRAQDSDPRAAPKACKDLCGDGVCQEIVCMALGCPCPENADTCPKDCK